MSIIVSVDQQSHTVTFGTHSSSGVSSSIQTGVQEQTVELDGALYTFDWQQIAAQAAAASSQKNATVGGYYNLIVNGRSYEVLARCITPADNGGREVYEIWLAGQRFEVVAEDERSRLLTATTRSGHKSNVTTLRAPMPGLVTNVLLEPGASVSEGQVIVVLEAMKMENDLTSPLRGMLKDVMVTRGQTVDQGALLAVIEGD